MRVIQSLSDSIQANLAWEELLLDRFEADGPALFFCVNDPAVVVGKNQNPWRETNPGFLADDGVELARRVSGGGTVYHDGGNLNYSLILSRHGYDPDQLFQRLLAALAGVGISAERMPGNSMGVAGRKFSGHAFCYRGSAVLHHGTLLVDTDLTQLRQAMQPALPGIMTRAVASRPASVMNLAEARPGLNMDELRRVLAAEYAPGVPLVTCSPPEGEMEWQRLRDRYGSWDWILGYTPSFSWDLCAGGTVLTLMVDRGEIQDAILKKHDQQEHHAGLVGCRMSKPELQAALADELSEESALLAALGDLQF